MALVKHIGSLTEAQILALTNQSELWYEFGFYYPSDSNGGNYFFRLENGVMVKKGGVDNGNLTGGIGITLNNKVIGGIKTKINSNEILNIPEDWEYNAHKLDISGIINSEGTINIM